MKYDVIVVGAGPGGIFTAYELMEKKPEWKVAVFEAGHDLAHRRCPIDGEKVKSCIKCKSCSIMSGFGGAGAFSDGKYNITNDFGGTLYEYIGKKQALDLMHYVDQINLRYGGEGTKLYSRRGPGSRSCASRTTSTCWTPPCATWAPTSTTWCWRTCITTSRPRWTSSSTPPWSG